MSDADYRDLLQRALQLEPAQRLELATHLLESVDDLETDEWSQTWTRELRRRREELPSGVDQEESAQEVRAKPLKRLR